MAAMNHPFNQEKWNRVAVILISIYALIHGVIVLVKKITGGG